MDIKSFDGIVLPERQIADEPTNKTIKELRAAARILKAGAVAMAGGIANGAIVSVNATPAGVTVSHGLGRQCQGYVVISSSAAATFHNSAIGTGSSFTLFSSVATAAKLWVF
jgi:hypothetical protein